MMKFNPDDYASDVVVMSGKNAHFLCSVAAQPSMEAFPQLVNELKAKTRKDFKYLVWSPYTKPLGPKFAR
jgi:hypothetical protein